MVCSVPGPDGLQTHFDQLREYTHASYDNCITLLTVTLTVTVKLITSDRLDQWLSSSWSSATVRCIKEVLASDTQLVCVCVSCVCVYGFDTQRRLAQIFRGDEGEFTD